MKAIYQIVGMRWRGTEALVAALRDGEPLRLARDPFNEHDTNAIEVWVQGTLVGFIKAEDAVRLAARLDEKGDIEIAARFVSANRWPHAEVEE